MFFLGTFIDAGCILVFGLLGTLFKGKLPEKSSKDLLNICGVFVILIGFFISSRFKSFEVTVASVALGYVLGNLLGLQSKLESISSRIFQKSKRFSNGIAGPFVYASICSTVGSLGVLGAVQEGVYGDKSILLSKAAIDAIASFIFGSSMGIGVAFSFISVFVFQFAISYIASIWGEALFQPLIAPFSGAGGLIIAILGFQLLKVVDVKAADFLPSLVIAPLVASFWSAT